MEDLMVALGTAFVLAFVMAGPKARRGRGLPPKVEARSTTTKKA